MNIRKNKRIVVLVAVIAVEDAVVAGLIATASHVFESGYMELVGNLVAQV